MNDISIFLGGCVSETAVFSNMLHCQIEQETEKAIQLKAGKHTCWIPKKALTKTKNDSSYYKLAKWFKVEGFTAWFMDHYSNISGISAQ